MAIGGGYRPEEVVGRRYQIIKRLGQGGMGVVYEAEHMALKRRVAIKVPLPSYTEKADPSWTGSPLCGSVIGTKEASKPRTSTIYPREQPHLAPGRGVESVNAGQPPSTNAPLRRRI